MGEHALPVIPFYDEEKMKRFEFIGLAKNKSVLDIGNAGRSDVTDFLMKISKSYYGVDKKRGVNAEKYVHKQKVDCVFCGQTFHYLDNPDAFLEVTKKNLKKNGVLLLDVPNIFYFTRLIRYFFTGRYFMMKNKDCKRVYDLHHLKKHLESRGYRIVSSYYIGNFGRFSENIGVVAKLK